MNTKEHRFRSYETEVYGRREEKRVCEAEKKQPLKCKMIQKTVDMEFKRGECFMKDLTL